MVLAQVVSVSTREMTRRGRGMRHGTLFDPAARCRVSQMEQPHSGGPWRYSVETHRHSPSSHGPRLLPASAMNLGMVREREGGLRIMNETDQPSCDTDRHPLSALPDRVETPSSSSSDPSQVGSSVSSACQLCGRSTNNVMDVCDDRVCRKCLRTWWRNFPKMRNYCPFCRAPRQMMTDLRSPDT